MRPVVEKRNNELEKKMRSNDILLSPTPITAIKLRPEAEIPSKENYKNVGHDLIVIARCDNRTEDVYGDANTFSTGLILKAPKNYHLEIVEHPSLHKAGYMLVGAPHIINPDSNEELILSLYKFKESEDLELPFRAALVILRVSEYASIQTITPKKKRSYDDDDINDRRNMMPVIRKTPIGVPRKVGKNTSQLF